MSFDPVLNFAKVQVSTGYNDTDLSVALQTGDGAKLPAPAVVGAFNLVWWNFSDYADPADDPNVEIVRVTARSTDTLTITRAQEGTSASTKNTAGKTYKMILAATKKTYDDVATALSTSAGLAAQISDETGSGALVFATSPTLVTPNIGVATATSVNKITITAPASGATLTIQNGFTLTVSGNATVSGTNTGDQTIALASGSTGITSGTNTRVLFDDNGVVGEDAGFTYSKSSPAVTIASGTITANAPALTLTQTWNNSGVSFTGLKINITNTASASGSALIDLQTGGNEKFYIDALGRNLQFGDITGNKAISFNYDGSVTYTLQRNDGAAGTQVMQWAINSNFINFLGTATSTKNNITTTSTDGYVYSNATASTVSVQVQQSPRARWRAHVWNTSGTPADNVVDFIEELRPVAGASPTGSLIWSSRVSVSGSGSFTDVMTLASTGALTAASLGTTFGTVINATGDATLNSITSVGNNGIRWTSRGRILANVSDGILGLYNDSVNDFGRLQFGGTTSSFPAIKRSSASLAFRLADDSGDAGITASTAGFSGNVTITAANLVTDTSTGMKIGTATSQKLAFWNTAPIVQPTTAIAASTFVANTSGTLNDSATWDGYTIGQIVKALRNVGLLA